ncbi:class I SAM-dependent methyltransferase [Paenibacillus sp. 481]|uniref:class I SAM-dependent methyltransferase n=1 Tax=Paenibacillus sp. 481 TaxID=2835869 RepID=UPI001E3BDE5E|nr:class I SAM-dependent methyltransferase [Paenibacillus sp. 481]UHA71826.1 class I SAM-dependent methyltransferase [Paenibacillus sp. 481]
MSNQTICNVEDVMEMLDSLFREDRPWWDEFYQNREKPIPFFVNAPDENLVHYVQTYHLQPKKVLELGCGAGRNAIYMAEQGAVVDGVDISQTAINWGVERIKEQNVNNVNLMCKNIFELDIEVESYDFVYDCGCFHHLLPHRRIRYLELLHKALTPSGYFGLVCFARGDMGSEISDWEVYRLRSLQGGLGYTEQSIKAIFNSFKIIELRKMKKIEQPHALFGESFMWTALFQKK